MPHQKKRMPKTAKAFFRSHQGTQRQKTLVRNFHDWLRKNKIPLSKLTPEHIEAYLKKPAEKEIKESSQTRLYSDLKPYLAWLCTQKHLSFTPKGKTRELHPLPPSAVEYINTLKPVQKESTWRGHVCHLRAFHAWLTKENLPLSEIDRKHMEQWLQHLSQRGLSTTTRSHQIFNVGVYLRWLFEKEIIDAEPRYLLRPSDVPPKPKYLPRPFPPDTDREIQRRLAASDDLHHKALLLMRGTGLRIGELLRLAPDCLEKDHLDNASLKVPLGKLDN
jgi:site-specific recombinase XerD